MPRKNRKAPSRAVQKFNQFIRALGELETLSMIFGATRAARVTPCRTLEKMNTKLNKFTAALIFVNQAGGPALRGEIRIDVIGIAFYPKYIMKVV